MNSDDEKRLKYVVRNSTVDGLGIYEQMSDDCFCEVPLPALEHPRRAYEEVARLMNALAESERARKEANRQRDGWMNDHSSTATTLIAERRRCDELRVALAGERAKREEFRGAAWAAARAADAADLRAEAAEARVRELEESGRHCDTCRCIY